MVAWRALRKPPANCIDRDADDDHFLAPRELQRLLDSVALCPAFSDEMYRPGGPLDRHLFCSEDAFGGCRRRRQFFRNQMLRLHYEKALHVGHALRLLEEGEGCDDLVFEGILSCEEVPDDVPGAGWEDGGRSDDVAESDAEQALDEVDSGIVDSDLAGSDDEDEFGPAGDGGGRRFAEFLVESQAAEFLPACSKGYLFLARHAPEGTSGQLGVGARAAAEGDRRECREDSSATAWSWSVGVAEKITAPPGSRISLVQLNLCPVRLGEAASSGTGHGDRYEIVPISFLPIVFRRQRKTVTELCEGDPRFTEFVQQLVFPPQPHPAPDGDQRSGTLEVDQTGVQPSTSQCSSTPLVSDLHAQLNSRQRLAVELAVGGRPLTLVQGPPGTGKTAVAVAIVEAWLEQDPKTPILVATGTHSARKLISSRLEARGIVLSQRRDLLLGRKLRRGAAPVFVETVYMAALPVKRELPRVLIDESSQITEAAALVAMGQKCQKLVLIGDPRQLGPVSNLGQVRSSNPELAPFSQECESVYELMRQRHGLQPVVLREQYRMSRLLCAYPSERFYDGELVTAVGMEEAQPPECLRPFALLGEGSPEGDTAAPTIFVDTASLDDRWEETVPFHGARSLRNNLEAEIVARIVKGLEDSRIRSEDISILTGYGAQRDRLASAVHGAASTQGGRRTQQRAAKILLHGLDPLEEEPHPRVHTVDGFQGSENEIVIFSGVRSNQRSATGFAGAPQRVCVLLTRARRALVVVGDSSTLREDEEWRTWLEKAPKQLVRLVPGSLAGSPPRAAPPQLPDG